MSPRKMHELIEKHIKRVMVNPDLFADTKAKEAREKYELQLVAEDFEEKNFEE